MTYNTSVLYIHPRPEKNLEDNRRPDDPWLWQYITIGRLLRSDMSVGLQHTYFEEKVREYHKVPEDVKIILWTDRGLGKQVFYYGPMELLDVYNFILKHSRSNWFEFNDRTVDFIFY